MQEIFKLLIGMGVLVLGYFIGEWLTKITKEELIEGKKWFLILVVVGLGGGIYGLIIGNDFLLFTMFFISIIASRSLRKSFDLKRQKDINKNRKNQKVKSK